MDIEEFVEERIVNLGGSLKTKKGHVRSTWPQDIRLGKCALERSGCPLERRG
jgi:hypothetical protein